MLGQNVRFQTYFMQYFASILAYTGAIAGIQRKKKGNDQDLTKYLINDCSSAGLCVYAC